MKPTIIRLADKDGNPINDYRQAARAIGRFIAHEHPKKKQQNIKITRLDDNGNWSVTI